MGDSNGDEDGGGVNGDGSGGNSLSRQGAGIETFVPRNWSSMAAALRNFSWMDADSFRVLALEGIYRRKGNVRGHPGGPHHLVAWSRGDPRHPMVWQAPGPPPSLLWTPSSCWKKIGGLAFILSNSENISCVTFLKYKNSRKHELALWHLVNRLVPENA
jgi:hypothetical protein